MAARKPWVAFAILKSESPRAVKVDPAHLVDMAGYPDALTAFAAYAQDSHVFDAKGYPQPVDAQTYARTPREEKLNKFGKAYRDDAKIWLHQDMAAVVVAAARFMKAQYGWHTVLYDGLRTVDGAYLLYRNAAASDLEEGLLAPPGLSAHNKGMAADLVQFDQEGRLVQMGGNFDHLDMKTNSRNCADLPPEVLENRIRREIAFQHAALSQGKLFAPLRSEFWDERFPENEADHWRVLESLARCLGQRLLSEEEERNRKEAAGTPAREAFRHTWEDMDYATLAVKWRQLFNDAALRRVLKLDASVALPPARETVVYHGDFHPLYDRDLLASGKNLTDGADRG